MEAWTTSNTWNPRPVARTLPPRLVTWLAIFGLLAPGSPLAVAAATQDATGHVTAESTDASEATAGAESTADAQLAAVANDDSQTRVALGTLVENIACTTDPTQTYTLYLPSTYTTERRWPVLFVFDPRGRSGMAAEIFLPAAERYGWILMSSDNTRSDGAWDPNFKAIAAMGPDAARFAYDQDRIYAAGFSGGAMLAWLWGQQSGGLAGVIGSGGRPVESSIPATEVPFAFFGAAGDEEFNYEPTLQLIDTAARAGAPHRFESFPGPHAWMPPKLAFEAVEWMEVQAMQAGTREADPDLLAEVFAKDLARARELERSGRLLEAERRYDAIARTFAGLLDVQEIVDRAAALAKSSDVKKAMEAEKAARRYEEFQRDRMSRALSGFSATGESTRQRPVRSSGQLEGTLRLSGLLEAAREETAKGFAARRTLNWLSSQLAFYLPRTFFQNRDYRRAAVVLELATIIGPPRPSLLYDLACARARSGATKKAIEALTDAVGAGYSNLEHMQQDSDLENLRDLPAYQDLVARMKEVERHKTSYSSASDTDGH